MTETIEYRGYTVKIVRDSDPWNPREWDNLGTMVCAHSRYRLGDTMPGDRKFSKGHPYFASVDDFNGWLHEQGDNVISLPLYLYDHSGITMNTSGFSCPWDSGMVGVIYITKDKAREEFSWKYITQKRRERLLQCLRNEVETYDDYLTGAVYGFQIIDPEDGEEILDSCFAFYGYDYEKSGLLPEVRGIIDFYHRKAEEEREEFRLKVLAEKNALFNSLLVGSVGL